MKKLLIGLIALSSMSTFSQSFSDRSENMTNGVSCFMAIDVHSNSVAEGVQFCQDLVKVKAQNNPDALKSFSDRLESLRLDGTLKDSRI